jgi:calcineurin-like phosphoesterase family protein
VANIFFISDTHFGQASMLTFTYHNPGCPCLGAQVGCMERLPLRRFSSVEEMDEHMVERWNSVVRPQDHIYHLGDIAMAKRNLPIVSRLNGHKRLIPGNHDIFPKEYPKYFEHIWGLRVLDKMIFSHVPLHPRSIGKFRANVHGHIHMDGSFGRPYFNVSVEAVNYTPISLEQIKAAL